MNTMNRVEALIRERKTTKKALAEKIGVKQTTVTDWAKGRSESYTKYLPQIADALGTTVQYLLTGDDGQSKQAAAPKGSGLDEEFARIFMTLTPEKQNKIIAEMLRLQRDE